MRMLRRRTAPALVAACCGIFAAVAVAQETSSYPADPEARLFSTSAGGWGGTSSSAGFCNDVGLCPTITNSFQPSGGTGGSGDGFLRSQLDPSVAAVKGETSATWLSPTFTYQGAAGQAPDTIQFVIHRRADIAPFLSVTGTGADYTVEVVNADSGVVAAVPVDQQPIGDSADWVPVSLPVDPALLTMGQDYRLRITSHFTFGAEVQPGVTVDYDELGLTATKQPPAPAGPAGAPGAPGSPGHHGAQGPPGKGEIDVAFLNSFIKNNTRNWIGINGRNGEVLVRCPGRAKQKAKSCRFELTVLVKRRGPNGSGTAKLSLRPKGKRVVDLRLRRGFVAQLRKRQTVLVRYRVRVGPLHTTVYKQLRVIHCERAATC